MLVASLLPLLLLLTSVSADPRARLGRKNLSDEDILKALAILLAEAEGEAPRQGRIQELEELEEEARQGPGRGLNRQEDFEALDGECTTTGYEVRTREECEEIHEIKCETINVTKHRQEIVPKCQTLVDQQCNVTYVDVPTQQCKARQRNRCETIYRVVEDRQYREECKVDVQHVCEHHVPVEVPYEVPYAVEATTDPPPEPVYSPPNNPGAAYGPPTPPGAVYGPPEPPEQVYNPPITPSPPPPPPPTAPAYQFVAYSGSAEEHPAEPHYHYDPTPGPNQAVSRLSRQTSQPQVVPLFSKARRRRRRSVLFPSGENINLGGSPGSQDQLRGLVRDILSNVMTDNKQLAKLKATIKEPRSIDPANYDLNLFQAQQDHHHLAEKLSLQQPIGGDLFGGGPPPVPRQPHLGGEVVVPHPQPVQPVVTTQELPAPEGCRSIAVKKCYKIPIILPRKVPYEVCEVVPDVDCVNVLKKVPELQCTPEVSRECNDVEKKVPYLEPAEDCVEITFDECQEIIERVPVELCKRKRVDEDSITLSRGKVERKEGEKRRTPAFRRAVNQKGPKKSSTQTDSASKPVRLTLRDL